eukprot:c16956_g1_i2.p1 GENE.c16956_g1_i2~~c16956_g1_i2.p1  ORF type:complete len:195 (+),score=31.55 c16956_g1_i2:718-1302(+)
MESSKIFPDHLHKIRFEITFCFAAKQNFLRLFLQPVLVSALLGAFVSVLPGAKQALLSSKEAFYVIHIPFTVIDRIGRAAVPFIALTVGASLWNTGGRLTQHIQFRLVFVVLVIRLFLLPAITTAFVLALRNLDLIPDDPLLLVVSLAFSAMPTACHLSSLGPTKIGPLLRLQYVAAVFLGTAWLHLFLAKSSS